MRRRIWLPREKLQEWQRRRLQRLLHHAGDHVPFYRDRFEAAGLCPGDIRRVADLRLLPLLTRQDLQNAGQAIVAQGTDLARCHRQRTSGSTGIPLTLYLSPAEKLNRTLVNLRLLLENGFRFTDRLTYVGDPRHFPRQDLWFQKLGLLRRYYVSVFDPVESQVERLDQDRPDVIYAYATQLTALARAIVARGALRFKPKLVFTTAEMLPSGAGRLIQRAFGCRAINVYGCVEVGDIAWQCAAGGGLHVNSDNLVVEIVRAGRPAEPGETGEIVVTCLATYTSPLIRYRLGDVGSWSAEPCPCGRGLPILQEMQGRQDDHILLADGQTCPPVLFAVVMKHFADEIAHYAIKQRQPGAILLQLVPGLAFSKETPANIISQIRHDVSPGLTVEAKIVDEIPRDRSGKIRSVESSLWPDSRRQEL